SNGRPSSSSSKLRRTRKSSGPCGTGRLWDQHHQRSCSTSQDSPRKASYKDEPQGGTKLVRIAHLRVHSIAIADPPLRSSYGLHSPYALRTILELESDDGIIGISETHGGDAIATGFESLRARIIGADPYSLCGSLLPMIEGDAQGTSLDRSQTYHVPGENPLDAAVRLYSAIEIACLDLIGKSVGKPVCDLLGGRARNEVPFSAYLFYKHAGGGGKGTDARADEYGEGLTPEAMVRQAKQMIAKDGFRDIKLKAGGLDPDLQTQTIPPPPRP